MCVRACVHAYEASNCLMMVVLLECLVCTSKMLNKKFTIVMHLKQKAPTGMWPLHLG